MPDIAHRTIETNGIRMHVAEAGPADGPLVVLCHGWPELWYSWRHQIPALAAAGYRVAAPDQRGYGDTDAPQPIEAYSILQLVGDIVGLVGALDAREAVVVGHDWGAPVAWSCGLLRPDLFKAVGLLSVPYAPRPHHPPMERAKVLTAGRNFYQLYFQEPGRVEAELEEDIRASLARVYFAASGEAGARAGADFTFDADKRFVDALPQAGTMPWLSAADLDVFAQAYRKSGFRGPINWYRNIDRNWALTPFLAGARLNQPSLFVAGERDLVIGMMPDAYAGLESNAPGLTQKVLLPQAGHWIQQERPDEVNAYLIGFLKQVAPVKKAA
jgi:pimeloyl-ACP methyl ester carboxylesterase